MKRNKKRKTHRFCVMPVMQQWCFNNQKSLFMGLFGVCFCWLRVREYQVGWFFSEWIYQNTLRLEFLTAFCCANDMLYKCMRSKIKTPHIASKRESTFPQRNFGLFFGKHFFMSGNTIFPLPSWHSFLAFRR